MSELRKQICDYYGSQSLPPGKVAAIIAKGRAVAGDDSQSQLAPEPLVSRFVHWRSLLALAASVTVLAMAWQFSRNSSAVDFGQTRRGLASFFAVSPSFPLSSAQPEELRQWALAHGAPAFQIPAKLSNLSGEACTTLDIEGKPAFLLVFQDSGRQRSTRWRPRASSSRLAAQIIGTRWNQVCPRLSPRADGLSRRGQRTRLFIRSPVQRVPRRFVSFLRQETFRNRMGFQSLAAVWKANGG